MKGRALACERIRVSKSAYYMVGVQGRVRLREAVPVLESAIVSEGVS